MRSLKEKIWSLFITLGLFWVIGFVLFAYTINHYTINTQTKTDAIIVLTGGKNRIAEGIELLNNNLSPKLFISGVSKQTAMKEIENMANIKADDLSKITLGHKATNTIENASETMEWIKNNKITSIRLVTSNYHMPRSMEEFLYYGKDLTIIKHPVYSPNVSAEWWNKWGTFKLILIEYNKFLIVYTFRHLQKMREN